MNKTHIPIRDVWEFEKYLATKPKVWLNEAFNLRYSAEALFLYDEKVRKCIFTDKIPPPLPSFFSSRVERLLMGFSVENLLKAILLQNPEKLNKAFGKDGNLSWGKDGHNLLILFDEANIPLSKTEKRFIEVWQTCAIWAGRYPLPKNENALPRQRVGLPSSEAVGKRRQKTVEKAIQEGDELLGAELNDLLHGGVGDLEHTLYQSLFDRCKSILVEEE